MKKSLQFDAHARIAICSDVHLDDEPSDLTHHFQEELTQISQDVDAIILLGDIFHYWLGDKCVQRYAQTMERLKKISERCNVYFMPGNRDFLLDTRVLSKFNVVLLNDPCVMVHGDKRIFLTHGDQYCSLDTAYLRLRYVIQHPFTKVLARIVPYAWRFCIAEYLRAKSRLHTPSKSQTTMDIYFPSLEQAMLSHNSSLVIYGHVHYLRDCVLEHRTKSRCITLDSWQHQTNFCFITEKTIELITR